MPNLKGGDGYTFDVNRNIGGLMGRSRYSFNYAPIYNGELLQGGGDCGCNVEKVEHSLFNILKQTGGYQKKNSKLDAIQYVSQSLSQLSAQQLTSVVQLITDYHLKKTQTKEIQELKKGGNQVSSIMAPLGRANLIVLAALLLLHHFAVEMPEDKKKKTDKGMKKGGSKKEKTDQQLEKLLQPLKYNQKKIGNLVGDLKNAFGIKDNQKINIDQYDSYKGGSSVLKSIIAPLGTSAFIASGLLVILDKVVNQKKLEEHDKGNMKKGGQMEIGDISMNKLIDVITPISFNVFANESFVKTLLQQKNKNITINKKINNRSIKNGGRGDPLRGFDIHTLGGLGAMGTNLDNISTNSSGKNILLNSKEMNVSGGGKIVKKKTGQKKSSSNKMRGGEETWGATGMPKEFYSATSKMTGYPANSGVNVKTAYGPQKPFSVGIGMLAPNTTSISSTANPATNMKTGGALKKKKDARKKVEKKKKVVKKKVMKEDDKKKETKKKVVKKKVMKKDDKKKVMKKDDKKKVEKKKKVVKKKVMKKDDKKKKVVKKKTVKK